MIKSFRGLLADGGQDKIRLSTKKGKIGYKIKHFVVLAQTPGTGGGHEAVVKVYKTKQTTIDGAVDFSDHNLLAVDYYSDQDAPSYTAQSMVMFEQEIFNQDIYITGYDADGSNSINYYLELETITLNDNQAAVSTLRDIRLNPQVGA